MMNEPSLSSIEDYNTLTGEKRRVVWAVIVSGLVIGAIYIGAKLMYDEVDDAIAIDARVVKVPLR